MYRYLKKKSIVIFHIILIFVLTGGNAWSGHKSVAEDEMETLRLFYQEKDLVVDSAARYPKHISQVAENVTVVDEEDIRAMNAHTILEVLNNVPGILVGGHAGDFGSEGLVFIQGSKERHVLVLVDDIPMNNLNNGAGITNTIPVGIIRRIEIIKGPASSIWGASLGGVVNIMTKRTGEGKAPSGSVRMSYGERDIIDCRGDVSGKLGTAGYYLFAGRQDSGKLMDGRYFDSDNFFSKWTVPVFEKTKFEFSIGYNEPHDGFGDFPEGDMTSSGIGRSFVTVLSLVSSLADQLELNMSLYCLDQKYVLMNDAMGLGIFGENRELYMDSSWDEKAHGGSVKFVFTYDSHTVLLGSDFNQGKMAQRIETGPYLQSAGLQKVTDSEADIQKWAVYVNDTFSLGNFYISPGIRIDQNDISGSFVSPSMGATYRPNDETILRVSVGRGFTLPPLTITSGGGYYLDPNPSLNPEEVWSYQLGAESFIADVLWVKGTIFQHDLEGHLKREYKAGGPPLYNDMYFNVGEMRRRGFEIEAETAPFAHISFSAGFSFVNTDFFDADEEDAARSGEDESANRYSYQARIEYDNKKYVTARFSGHYVWWDTTNSNEDLICDLNIVKSFDTPNETHTDLFVSARNIFNGALYETNGYKNPDRWIETGIRFHF